uniref:Uncharacterized protein n=1 Tax=Oryza barthii TaxID=65489 RepID=A0A0D3F883_9ORYZ
MTAPPAAPRGILICCQEPREKKCHKHLNTLPASMVALCWCPHGRSNFSLLGAETVPHGISWERSSIKSS